jgi:hypothetical protein
MTTSNTARRQRIATATAAAAAAIAITALGQTPTASAEPAGNGQGVDYQTCVKLARAMSVTPHSDLQIQASCCASAGGVIYDIGNGQFACVGAGHASQPGRAPSPGTGTASTGRPLDPTRLANS